MMAISALPPQKEVTDQRDIVIKLNRPLTMRTMRTWGNDRFPFGDSIDTDI
jgi:hypothetical protein